MSVTLCAMCGYDELGLSFHRSLLAHTYAAHSAANGISFFCTVVGSDDGGGPAYEK